MIRLNCWEFMKCGMGNGESGRMGENICPVAADATAHGLNRGMNGGRLCWIVAESHRDKHIPCLQSQRQDPCFSCQFRFKVTGEEGLLNVCESTGSYLQRTGKGKTGKKILLPEREKR